MNTTAFVLIIIVALVAALFGSAIGIKLTSEKGVNVGEVIQTGTGVIDAAEGIANTLKPIIPNGVYSVVEFILKLAKTAAGGAEQLYKAGTVSADQRKITATEFIKSTLKADGIAITPEIEKIIDIAIEAEVLLLPHAEKALAAVTGAQV